MSKLSRAAHLHFHTKHLKPYTSFIVPNALTPSFPSPRTVALLLALSSLSPLPWTRFEFVS